MSPPQPRHFRELSQEAVVELTQAITSKVSSVFFKRGQGVDLMFSVSLLLCPSAASSLTPFTFFVSLSPAIILSI